MSDAMIRDFWQGKRINGGVVERRALEPVCTALLTHSYKLALQGCQKALRIKTYWPVIQILQAITMHRQQEHSAALALTSELAKDDKGKGKALLDPDFLLLASWLFEQNGKQSDAAAMWQTATDSHPTNLNLAVEACYYYLRISAYKHLQELCQRILENRPTNPTESTNTDASARQEEVYLQFTWFMIAAIVILVGDASPSSSSSSSTSTSSEKTSDSSYPKYRISKDESTNPPSQEDVRSMLQLAYETLTSQKDPIEPRTHHDFYLVSRILQQRGELEQRTSGQSTSTSDDPMAELRKHLASEKGLEFARKNLDIELYRRNILLEYGIAQEIEGLWQEMCDNLLDPEKKDTNWSTILTAIKAAHSCAQSGTSPKYDSADTEKWWLDDSAEEGETPSLAFSRLRKTKKMLEDLGREDGEGFSKKDRGYTVGLLQLATYGANKEATGPLPELVILYFDRHADKNCCFEELRPYLAMLHDKPQQVQQILSWLQQKYSLQGIDVSSLKMLQASINAERVRRYLQGSYGTIEEELERGHRCAKAYYAALHFGKDNLPTDLQPADDLALLSAQCYLGAWTVSSRSRPTDSSSSTSTSPPTAHLELAICILEYAIRRSKYRYQIRVLLIRLYRLAGAPSLALKHYRALEPKQIQLDSLAFWALERASTFAVLPAAPGKAGAVTVGSGKDNMGSTEYVEATTAWYAQADSETSTSLVRAWQNHAFSLVEDYTALSDRLRNSFSRQSVALEMWRCRSMRDTLTEEQRSKMLHLTSSILLMDGASSDNRDESILPNYQPSTEEPVVEQTRMADQTTPEWLRRMCVIYASFSSNEEIQLDGDETVPSCGLSEYENQLLEWTQTVTSWLSGKTAKAEDAVIIGFMKGCQADLAKADLSLPLWQILHTAALALEAYALLDLAFTTKSSNPGEFKNIKQFRQIRQDTKGCLKAICTRLKVFSDDLARTYKGKNKLESLAPMKQFEQVGDDFLLEVATELLESRKTALVQLAATITKRIAGS